MAENPILHNDGGIYRFQDYLSQVPGFLKNEEDVVILMQLFSDYINNAYRNITVVKKFEFKLIAVESRLGTNMKYLEKLANLFKESADRSDTMLFLSKPISTPVTSNNYFIGIFEYNGTLESLSPSVINNIDLSDKDGSRVYIEFTKDEQASNSGVYVYNKIDGTLTIDPFGTSQDPFLNTPNKPIPTVGGLAPRMIEFTPSNVSKIRVRKAKVVGTTVYYEIFFTATIDNITDITSIEEVEVDSDGDGVTNYKYIIDYYDAMNGLPSKYRYKYAIAFPDGCEDFDWNDPRTQGGGLFYARDLTQYGKENLLNINGNNKYIDPIFNENTTSIAIKTITRAEQGTVLTVTTNEAHKLVVGDIVNIRDTINFNEKNLSVTEVVNSIQFKCNISAAVGVTEFAGNVITTNLFGDKRRNIVNKYFLQIPYTNLEGITEFQEGDFIRRLTDQDEEVSETFDASNVVIETDAIVMDSDSYFQKFPTYQLLALNKIGTATIPTGLEEGVVYEVNSLGYTNEIFLTGVNITAVGTGKFDIVKLVKYFNAETDVDIETNEITLNGGEPLGDGTLSDPFDDISVNDAVRLTTVGSSTTLPAPLTEEATYSILALDTTNNTVTLSSDGINSVDITAVGSGIISFVKLVQSDNDIGKIKSVSVTSAGESGIITLEQHKGDLISEGMIGALDAGLVNFRADINSTAIPWTNTLSDTEKTHYKKGVLVVYQGIRYQLLNYVSIDEKSKKPNEDAKNYLKYMQNIITYDTVIESTPYMFGMYAPVSLAFEEEPDFNDGYNELSSRMYIRKVEDLELIYGHDQREWIFNPRLAPLNVLNRNGYLEAIKGTESNDIVENDVSPYIVSGSSYALMLEELTSKIIRTVTLTYSETTGLITAETGVIDHRFKTGLRIDIAGAAPTEYNGRFTITVVDSNTFTYEPTTEPSVTTATGDITATFENFTEHAIEEISVVDSTTVSVITTDAHEYKDGITVIIRGATDPNYNDTFGPITISTVNNNQFTFQVADTTGFPNPDTSTIAAVYYQPVDGDYINATSQTDISKRGIYVAREGNWEKYDETEISDNVILFAKQNLFNVTDNNPAVGKGELYTASSLTRSSNDVTVVLYEKHDYAVGTVINIRNASESDYNGVFEVSEIVSTNSFKYKIKDEITPTTPSVPLTNKVITCQSDKWYKYTINDIQWQKISNSLTYTTPTGNTEHDIEPKDETTEFVNNIEVLNGEYNFTYTTTSGTETVSFADGDVVNLSDQIISVENGKYRVEKGDWRRLDVRLMMKIRDITVDNVIVNDPTQIDTDDPALYATFNETDVDAFITANFTGNLQVFKLDNPLAPNFLFLLEKVDNVDTTASFHKLYDAKFDKNTVADRTDMDSSFVGVPDMKYPLTEKIERLVYLKDPNVIDFDLISHLARYMGYDITPLLDDVAESVFYKTEKELQMAVRKAIQNLPQFYTLKNTKSGLEALLLTFGIVADVVTLWTESNKPYEEFIPDYQVRDLQYTRMIDNNPINLVPTPHFKLNVEIEGNFDSQLIFREVDRIIANIDKYKPINTVFDGLIYYLKATFGATVYIGNMKSVGRMQSDIGYDAIEFDHGATLNNDCV